MNINGSLGVNRIFQVSVLLACLFALSACQTGGKKEMADCETKNLPVDANKDDPNRCFHYSRGLYKDYAGKLKSINAEVEPEHTTTMPDPPVIHEEKAEYMIPERRTIRFQKD